MTKPNFRIVEVSDSERNYDEYYEDFKEDFLNPLFSVDDLFEKYPIPRYVYKEWSKKIKEEHCLTKKPTYVAQSKKGIHCTKENMNIYRMSNCYGISKYFKGERIYFGKYPDLETAKKVRNILFENDWDTSLVPSLMEEYGYTKERKLYSDAMKHYDEFKELYLANPPVLYRDILKKLDITDGMYSILRSEFRKECPDVKKTRAYKKKKVPVPAKPIKSKIKERSLRYIHKQHNGTFTVTKHMNGVHKSFGTYKALDDAIRRRNSLEANGWVA